MVSSFTLVAGLALAAVAPPGAVLITVDTLRADHVGFASEPRVETPALRRLASRGTVFEDAYAPAPATAPSHASLFTGLYPSFHTVGRHNGRFRLVGTSPTLAELLRDQGVSTVAVVSNPVLVRGLGLERGFERFHDEMRKRELNREHREQTADEAVQKALAELTRLEEGGSFLLWLHLQDPHGPYTPPPAWLEAEGSQTRDGDEATLPLGSDQSGHRAIPRYQQLGGERRAESYRRAYRAEVAYLDHEIAPLLDRLRDDPRFANTLVIVTADHGEALGEDDFYFAHGHSVGGELTRVPLLLAGPGVPAGLRVPGAVSIVALFATLLDHFGQGVPEISQAASLLPLLRSPEPRGTEAVYCESHNQVAVARAQGFLRRDRRESRQPGFFERPNPDTGGFWKPLETEIRGADPAGGGELAELLDRYEKIAKSAARRLAKHRELRDSRRDPEELDRLRALGYIR